MLGDPSNGGNDFEMGVIPIYRLWPREIYQREMEQDGTYGDQVTLQVISSIYTIKILNIIIVFYIITVYLHIK